MTSPQGLWGPSWADRGVAVPSSTAWNLELCGPGSHRRLVDNMDGLCAQSNTPWPTPGLRSPEPPGSARATSDMPSGPTGSEGPQLGAPEHAQNRQRGGLQTRIIRTTTGKTVTVDTDEPACLSGFLLHPGDDSVRGSALQGWRICILGSRESGRLGPAGKEW